MTPAGRWVRLDTTWSQSSWVADLEPAARLAWVELLCYVKAHGVGGEAKRLDPNIFSRIIAVTRNDVTLMEAAAIRDGALAIEGGKWLVMSWGEYQSDPTASERMRRYRERQEQLTQNEGDVSVTDVTRNGRNVTAVTPTETETKTHTSLSVHDFPAKPKKDAAGNYEYPEPFERAWSEFPGRDGSNPKVGAYGAFRARVAEGAEPEQLVIAARHYRQHCQAREKEGTPFVLQASTFYGPKEPWREYVQPPVANGSSAKRESVPFGKGGARMEL